MRATLGMVLLTFRVAQAGSLKDKRRILKSFKDRLRNRYNVSVSEVDAQDSIRQAVLAVAMVGSEKSFVEGRLQMIINVAARHRDMILVDQAIDWF